MKRITQVEREIGTYVPIRPLTACSDSKTWGLRKPGRGLDVAPQLHRMISLCECQAKPPRRWNWVQAAANGP